MNFCLCVIIYFTFIINNLIGSVSFSEIEQAFHDDDATALASIFNHHHLDPNFKVDHNKRLLAYCLEHQKLNLTKFLIKEGADMSTRDLCGISALAASYQTDHRLLEMILTKNPALLKSPVNAIEDTLVLFISRPPLTKKDVKLIMHLLTRYGASPLVKNKRQDSLIDIAFSIAGENYLELIRLLIDAGQLSLGYTFTYQKQPTTVQAHIFKQQLQHRLLSDQILAAIEKKHKKQDGEEYQTQSGFLELLFEDQ